MERLNPCRYFDRISRITPSEDEKYVENYPGLQGRPQPQSPFFVGRVKRQRNPTHLLGFVPQSNLEIKTFFDLDKVLLSENFLPSS